MPDYFEIYLNQLFVTLGQLSAAVISTGVVVPIYSYYTKVNVKKLLNKIVKDD